MPRDLPIGNGALLAAFDSDYRIRDFYFPRVGKENHALGFPWRLGVWSNGAFSWVNRQDWELHMDYAPDSLVTAVTATQPQMGLRLHCNDVIDYENNVLIRRIRVQSLAGRDFAVRIFFHTDLNVLENEIGDTVFFDPKNDCLIHYKGPRYFLMSCATENVLGVTHFATGTKRNRGLDGTWKDAEDGNLSGNAISQGAVDSVIGVELAAGPGQEAVCHYWMTVGKTYREVETLHRMVIRITPDRIIERNVNYWQRWVSTGERDFQKLPTLVVERYKRSLLILRTQIDQGGAVIAANDTDIRQFNQDTYSYMWPRDGAIVAQTLDRAGYGGLSQRFLEFCTQDVVSYNYSANILSETGFLMHKYNPDGSVGSSWQPWYEAGEVQFPIQEDETALVLWTIWNHYATHRDVEAIRHFYRPFVEQAADFLLSFRDDKTGLPLPSYDLWEERRGIFTYTVATVVAALNAAARLATLFHEEEKANAYLNGALQVKAALEKYLYCPLEGRFARGILFENGMQKRDTTVDASLLGMVIFGGFDPFDKRVADTMQVVADRLWVTGGIGGLARYEGDSYQRTLINSGIPGNPWIVCTLWLAQYRIAIARNMTALEQVIPLLVWVAERALQSGVLPEQVHPQSGEPLSVSPLTWSHATLVAAVLDYLDKAQMLGSVKPLRPAPAISTRTGRARP